MKTITLHLNYFTEWFYFDIILNQINIVQLIWGTITVPCKKSTIVSFASSKMKNVVVFLARLKFTVKLICWIALVSASRTCCLLKSVAIIFEFLWNRDNLINNQLCNMFSFVLVWSFIDWWEKFLSSILKLYFLILHLKNNSLCVL